jgi:hypothetical protein
MDPKQGVVFYNAAPATPSAAPNDHSVKSLPGRCLGLFILLPVLLGIPSVCAQTLNNQDSDNDGVSDLEETTIYRTHPFSADSDEDGIPDLTEIEDPELDPLNPAVFIPKRLFSIQFETNDGSNLNGIVPFKADHLELTDGAFLNGNRFSNASNGQLQFPYRQADGTPLVNLRRGSIRFWYRPDWSSRSMGGDGPGNFGRLLELGVNSSDFNQGWWSLYFNPFSDRIQLASKSSGFASPQLNVGIALEEGQWYQFVLTYNTTQIQLYLNGTQIGTGAGMQDFPRDADRVASGLWIGSSYLDGFQINGTLDALETFNYELNPDNIQADYEATQTDSDGDGINDFQEILIYGTKHTKADTDDDGINDLSEIEAGTSPTNPTEFPALQLASFDFDNGTLEGNRGQMPTTRLNIDWIRSWNNAAVSIGSRTPSVLSYAFQEKNLSPNINLPFGTIRFWISPNWRSGEKQDSVGRLLEVGRWTPDASQGWWALQFNENRELLQFITQGNGQSYFNISHGIEWRPDRWYHIALTYGLFESKLFINGELVQRGSGVSVYPSKETAIQSGIHLGGSQSGLFSANVRLDDVETFNYTLSDQEHLNYFLSTGPDPDGDGIISFDETLLYLTDPQNPDSDYDGVLDGQEIDEGTDPSLDFDVLPRQLASFGFEGASLEGNRNQRPLIKGSHRQIPGWKGYGVELTSKEVQQFSYRDVERNGLPNINVKRGSARFWIRPNWDSGNGPNGDAPLLEMGAPSEDQLNGWWSLHLTDHGRRIRIQFQGRGRTFTGFNHQIDWKEGEWHHVVASYDISGSELWIDGDKVASGLGTIEFPNLETRAETGMIVGVSPRRPLAIEGTMDELVTYNYRLSPAEIEADYSPVPPDSDTDGLSDIDELTIYLTNHLDPDTDADGVPDGQEILEGTNPLDDSVFEPRLLSRFSFNDPSLTGEQGQIPLTANQANVEESFPMGGTGFRSDDGSLLVYNVKEPNGKLNIDLRRGAVRFWFKPNWSSGEKGHPFGARLLEVGKFQSNEGWWGLFLNQDRTEITFASQGPDTNLMTTYLKTSKLDFRKDQWYEIELNYGPKTVHAYGVRSPQNAQFFANSFLYINGVQKGNGGGVDPSALPLPEAMSKGFAIGSQLNGDLNADALFEDLHCYNFPQNIWNGNILKDRSWTVEHSTSPPQIVLKRRLRLSPEGLLPVFVEKRNFGESEWTIMEEDFRRDSWTDHDVRPGGIYEYRLRDAGPSFSDTQRVTLTVAMNLPPMHFRGNVILITETGLPQALGSDYDTFRSDLIGDGWNLIDLPANRHDETDWPRNAAEIKRIRTQIDSIVQSWPEGYPHIIYILGHAPIPRSGQSAFDGHVGIPGTSSDHRGAWTADSFYGSLDDSLWSDTETKHHFSNRNLENLPGDEKWDNDFLPRTLEIPVGRIDFSGLYSFGLADFLELKDSHPWTLEVALTKQYIRKNHRYRHGQTSAKERVSYFNGLGFIPTKNGEHQAVNLAASLYGLKEGHAIASRPLYENTPVTFGYHEMNGSPVGIQLGWEVNRSVNSYSHFTWDLVRRENEPPILFYLMYGSWFGDWNHTNENWLRAVLATPNYGLVSLYYPRFWKLQKMALGTPIAVGIPEMGDSSDLYRVAPRMLSILGDPTLRLHVLAPPGPVTGRLENNMISLEWEPSPAEGCRYHVYRRHPAAGWELMNPTPSDATTYVDTNPDFSDPTYMVRAIRLQESGSGSYNNLSQGIYVKVK